MIRAHEPLLRSSRAEWVRVDCLGWNLDSDSY